MNFADGHKAGSIQMNSLPPSLCKAVELDTYSQPSKFFVCNAIYIFLGKKEKKKFSTRS